jgi:hypothetical protein
MAIANELSSDVAAAVLAHKEKGARAEIRDLVEIIRNFYSVLRPLTVEARRRRIRTHLSNGQQPLAGQAASASN